MLFKSILRSQTLQTLPAYKSAMNLLQQGQWFDARSELLKLKQMHSHSSTSFSTDSTVLSGLIGIASFYHGDYDRASEEFKTDSRLSIFAAGSEVERLFPDVCEMRKAIKSILSNGASSNIADAWRRYLLDPNKSVDMTRDSLVEKFRLFILSPNKENFDHLYNVTSDDLWSFTTKAQSAQIFAYRNPTILNITTALKAAESLRDSSPEGKALAPWYIAHSLILHGKLAINQGNALLGVSLFDAAKEQADSLVPSGRQEVLVNRCLKAKGELLLKWDKRENEGVRILESLKNFDTHVIADASEIFVPQPNIRALEQILDFQV